MKVSIIIPTKNEEKTIARVIKDLPKEYSIILIDKSKDKTAEIAKKLGVKVIKQKSNGKGNAIKEIINKVKSDLLIFIDGDYTYDTSNLELMINSIKKENYDLVYGKRLLIPYKNTSLFNYIGNVIFNIMATILYLTISKDLLTGFYAIKRSKLKEMNLKSGGFEVETEIFAKAAKKKLRIKWINTKYRKRIERTTKLNPIKDGWKILKAMLYFRIFN